MRLPYLEIPVSPATAPEKCLDGVLTVECFITSQQQHKKICLLTVTTHVRWETPRGRYDAVQQQVFPQKETKVIGPVGAAALLHTTKVNHKVVGGAVNRSPTWNLHTTQSNYFAPNETGRLSIFPACCNKEPAQNRSY